MSYCDYDYLESQSRPFIRRFEEASLRVKERRSKEQAVLKEYQENEQKLQQHLLTIADLEAQINVYTNADNAIATTKTNNIVTPLSDEQYQTTIVTKMVALIKQRKMK